MNDYNVMLTEKIKNGIKVLYSECTTVKTLYEFKNNYRV